MFQISDQGVAFIKRWEGQELTAYADIVGVWTVGYGWTGEIEVDGVLYPSVEAAVFRNGEAEPFDIDEATAEALLRRGLNRYEDGVNAAVRAPINQSMFDALVSWTYNIGVGGMRGSTAIKRLNQRDYPGAAEAITWWNKAGGRVVNGLVRRRAAEKDLFLSDLDSLLGNETPDEAAPGTQVEENTPRRSNPITTRTTTGAATAGAAGAAGAGAVLMDGDEDEPDDGATGGDTDSGTDTGTDTDAATGSDTDTTDTGSEDDTSDDGPTEAECADLLADAETDESDIDTEGAEDTPVDADLIAACEALLSDEGEQPGDDVPDVETPETDASDPGTSEPDASENDTPATDPVDDTTTPDETDTATSIEVPADIPTGAEAFSKRDATDAIVVAGGVLAVLAAIYVIGARIDDWRKYRR